MAEIILDIGSGNTHKNDFNYLKTMIDEIKKIDTQKHSIVFKHQLFKKAGDNIPLEHNIFERAYWYAKDLGYKTTASVFDKYSLDFLLRYDVPFVKIANNRANDWLIGEVPREIPVYISKNENTLIDLGIISQVRICDNNSKELFSLPYSPSNLRFLYCISKYPAKIEEYENGDYDFLYDGISDHTTNWDLFNKYKPEIYECHFKLEDSQGLDAGDFARTPAQLKEVL